MTSSTGRLNGLKVVREASSDDYEHIEEVIKKEKHGKNTKGK